MALFFVRSFISIRQANNYAGITQHWGIDTPAFTDPYDLAKDVNEAYHSPLGGSSVFSWLEACMSEDTFISAIRSQVVSPPNSNNAVEFFQDADHPGTYSGDVDTLNVAGCIIFLSDGDAGLTGRQFLPGVSENAYDQGRPDSAYTTAINDYVAGLLTGLDGSAGTWLPFIKHGPTPSFAAITAGYLSPSPGTQRRRRVPW